MIYNYNLDYMKQLKTYMKIRNIYFHICFLRYENKMGKMVKVSILLRHKKKGEVNDRKIL